MKIRIGSGALPAQAELVVTLVAEGKVPEAGPKLAAALSAARSTGDLKTAFRAVSRFHPAGKGQPRRLYCVGLGKAAEVSTERLRRAAAVAQSAAEEANVRSFRLCIPASVLGKVEIEAAACAIAEGLILGAYRYRPPQLEKPKKRHAQDCELVPVDADGRAFARGVALGRIGAEATVFARDLENQPSNICTPLALAQAARSLGRGVRVRVLERRDMERLGMGALLGVAQGSAKPPKLIVLEHGPARARRTVCVIGKGLTFDTGGISIKPAAKMDEMRYDMCGAGAVLGLFHALAHGGGSERRSATRLVGIIAAAENMPGHTAQNPGDVVRAMDGRTIEVLNTDAEGRLVLADAIAYARKTLRPDLMVDLATLTGAVVVALGHEVAGIMGNDQPLLDALIAAGKAADEPLWQLPLWDVHKEQMKSKFADLANINSGQGNGAIAGGAFLSYFAGDTKWAHLDIAGTAYGGISKDYYRNGAAGTAVRTLLHWVRSL